MIDFQEPTLADKPKADAVFHAGAYRGNDYCFGNIFIWRRRFKPAVAFAGGSLLVRFLLGGRPAYLYPAGGDIPTAVRALSADAAECGSRLRLAAVSKDMAHELEKIFPGAFEWTSNRSEADYIYRTSDLSDLAGRKYHSKRTHITHFKEMGDWSYEAISPQNLPECRAMNEEWFRQNEEAGDKSLKFEYAAIQETFDHYEELGFSGGMLRMGERVVAYTIGEPLCHDTFVVHFEKAFGNVDGAYPVINNEFVTHSCQKFEYVNREEDLGDEGLRRAKLSYQPVLLQDRGLAVLREGVAL